ncbi:MAG TPA: long-chain fatty acid--CoA ligase [Actinomycetota bacterium]|nr:long-chain fatty acid--CoA ligase [Actinomycetota bacterium]
MSLNLALLLRESAKAHPGKTALAVGDRRLTYEALDLHARQFAGGLRALGVERGQHVALLVPNVPHFTIAYFGAHYAGAPVVPLNVLLTADEIAYLLDDSDAVAIVAWDGFLAAAEAGFARAERCEHLIVARANPLDATAPEGAINMMALIAGAEPVSELPDTAPDESAVILYTSGTTGKPKGAELTHFNLFFNALYTSTLLVPLDSDTVALATLPLFHIFGQTVMQNATIGAGGTVVLLPRFEPKAAFDLLETHRVNFFGGVPTMYVALLNFPEADQYDLSSLKWCVCGGSAMPKEVMKAFDRKYDVNILEGYGLSETSPVAAFNTLDRPKKAGSIGMPIWGVEFRLVDNEGSVVEAPDTPGEIQIKGHNVMAGYWKRPEATAQAIKDGWFATGDIATRDADGYYFIVDRKKDMIIRGGFNVYPREIEEVLYGHPAVLEAAVIGIPHPTHGEDVKAVVVLRVGTTVTGQEIIDYCREHLAAYKYPRHVEFRDVLPKGPTGKILKRELRA